ncbi:hypothetical protein ACFQV8_21810 [Pseudonocardia benzenivorans]
MDDRREELARRLAQVRERIASACAAAGRDPGEVAMLAVTKTIPARDVVLLHGLGLRDFGENRAQEAAAKVVEVAELLGNPPAGAAPRWYFVGGLQRNKARLVAPWVTRVESVDSARLADALDAQAAARRTTASATVLPVLLQYSVDGDPGRGESRATGCSRSRRTSRGVRDCGSTG